MFSKSAQELSYSYIISVVLVVTFKASFISILAIQ